jgi:hypothetical protein
LALRKFIKSVVFSPNGKADKAVYEDAWKSVEDVNDDDFLRSIAIAYRRGHEASKQLRRQELFMQQQRLSSRIGGALISSFPIKPLQHIASYLHAPSRALFAVALGNFDMSSNSGRDFAPTKELSTASAIKRRKISEGLPPPQRGIGIGIGLGDVPVEALQHVASFLAAPSQVMFGLHVAAAEDKLLNKRSFAIAEEQSWDILDFGEIEKEVASRLSDDDIKAVLWCIDAGNKVKRLRLTNCVNFTGSGLEPLNGSEVIEQIDMSLVGDQEEPIPLETWHPPFHEIRWNSFYKDPVVCIPIDPRLSRELVLPVLDSMISSGSLKHLQFPKAWMVNVFWYPDWEPQPDFVQFLVRYNRFLMNRGISCAHCSRNLPSNGYQLVGDDWKVRNDFNFTYSKGSPFGKQNHTCSKCLTSYCYRCNDDDARRQTSDRRHGFGERLLERCGKCEREYCIECSDMFHCNCFHCHGYFCKDCRASVECAASECGNKFCEECDLHFCHECEKGFCEDCKFFCGRCEYPICDGCSNGGHVCQVCDKTMCPRCTMQCQQCENTFCDLDCTMESTYCPACEKTGTIREANLHLKPGGYYSPC